MADIKIKSTHLALQSHHVYILFICVLGVFVSVQFRCCCFVVSRSCLQLFLNFVFGQVPTYGFGDETDRHGHYKRKNTCNLHVSATRIQCKKFRPRIRPKIRNESLNLTILIPAILGDLLVSSAPRSAEHLNNRCCI